MIKPNQVCMIRGIPQNHPGYPFVGSVVTTTHVKRVQEGYGNIWAFEPHLVTTVEGKTLTVRGCAESWLYPLDSCEDDLAQEALDAALQNTFIETVMEKLNGTR